MCETVGKLKTGKSYADFIRAEHILNGSPKLIYHLHILFNSMLMHSYVPMSQLHGTMTPIVKDREGDQTCSSNYRGITLSHIFVQLFENLLRLKFGYFIGSDDLQFGFKTNHSTVHSIYAVKKTCDFFTNRGSSVYLAFLDCSKAFDRISHYGLFF